MLSKLREHAQGWIAWILVSLICLTFAIWGIGNYLVGGGGDEWKAKVNGKKISERQFRQNYDRLVGQMRDQFGNAFGITPEISKTLKTQALDNLIRSQVIYQALRRAGFRISPLDLRGFIESEPAFQVDGKFNLNRYQAMLGQMSYSENQYLDQLQQSLVVNQAQVGLQHSAFVLPDTLLYAINLVNQTRDFSYFVIPQESFSKTIKISEQDIQQYYDKHKQSLKTPEQISISYITLSAQAIRDKVANAMKDDDPRIMQFYKENMSDFSEPSQWHIAHILVRVKPGTDATVEAAAKAKIDEVSHKLKAGGDFDLLAKQYSDDVATRNRGGQMPWLNANHMSPKLSAAVTKLDKVGAISPVVKTKYGYQVIKLLGHKDSVAKPLAEVLPQIKKLLANQEAEKTFAMQKEQLADLTFANPNSLTQASTVLSLPVQKSELFSHKGGDSAITKDSNVVQHAFSDEVLTEGNNSDVMEIGSGKVIVLRVAEHKNAKIPELKEVSAHIKSVLFSERGKTDAKKRGQAIIKALRTGKPIDQVAKDFNFAWISQAQTKRNDFAKVSAEILAKLFQMPHPKQKYQPLYAGFARDGGDYVVLALRAVHTPQIKSLDKLSDNDRRIYQYQLQQGLGQLDYESFVQELMKEAKIVHNDTSSSSETEV